MMSGLLWPIFHQMSFLLTNWCHLWNEYLKLRFAFPDFGLVNLTQHHLTFTSHCISISTIQQLIRGFYFIIYKTKTLNQNTYNSGTNKWYLKLWYFQVYKNALDVRLDCFGAENLQVAVAHEDLAYATYVNEYSRGEKLFLFSPDGASTTNFNGW